MIWEELKVASQFQIRESLFGQKIIDRIQVISDGPLGDLEFLCQLCEAYFLFCFAQFPDHGNNSFVHTMFFL